MQIGLTKQRCHIRKICEGDRGLVAWPLYKRLAALFCGFFILARVRHVPGKRIPHKALYCAKLNTNAKYALKGAFLLYPLT